MFSCFAVLPPEVRYDKSISDRAKLLYAEITSTSNTYGLCHTEPIRFAAALGSDKRTIYRLLSELETTGHISYVKNGSTRAIKLSFGLSAPTEWATVDKPTAPPAELIDFIMRVCDYWKLRLGVTVARPELYEPKFRDRLRTFSMDELLSAAKARADFLALSEWHNLPENRSSLGLDHLLKDDDTVLKWLNTTTTPGLTPLVPMFKQHTHDVHGES
jgi:hypothetical protein